MREAVPSAALRPGRLVRSAASLAVALALASGARAQDDVSEQIWLDYNPSSSWPWGQVYGDLGLRTEIGDQGWVRLVARPSVRGAVGHGLGLAGGLGFFYTENKDFPDNLEIRPFQGIYSTWPHKPIRLDHYARLEEQFVFETDDWTLDTSLRFRYRLQTQYMWRGFRPGVHWRALFHVEAFVTLTGSGGQFEEKLRLGFGAERGFGPAARIRVDLTWQKTGVQIFGVPADDVYIRIRFFNSWSRRAAESLDD
jgi:hypothetical protein